MSRLQRFLLRVMPASWAASMEAESRSWMARCPCGHSRSVWDLGGVRWKARGEPRRLLRCPQCSRTRWHRIHRDSQPPV